MTKKQRLHRFLQSAVAALSAVLLGLCSYAQAKYIQNDKLEAQVAITAEIGSVSVWEYEAQRQNNGSYALITDKKVTHNSYTLLPGLDVPKNPRVQITKPNDLPVYVYVEIVQNLPGAVTYSLTSDWTPLTGITGPNKGTVYYYEDKITTGTEIQILANDMLYVSQNLSKATKASMTFYAYIYQAAAGSDAASVYNYYHPQN